MGVLISATSNVSAATGFNEGQQTLLSGDRILLGTIEEIRGSQARVDTGEIQPRYLPMNVRKGKGLPALKKGDRVEITVNDQNLIVDIHVVGEESHHRILVGKLPQPLITGHEKAVIRTEDGQEESHVVRPLARSKVASVPVGAQAVFLLDEMQQIVDVTYGSKEAVAEAQQLWQKKSPPKASFSRVTGVILKPLDSNIIIIQTEGGAEQSYEVRPIPQKNLAKLSKGETVALFIDDENKVTDASSIGFGHQ
ncbi:MAG: hypothetical protein AB7P17_07650 [Nitrospirales bacterium]|nr:hypothetical protein [Nitrospirales bacterium]